jgi:hypothetical protein
VLLAAITAELVAAAIRDEVPAEARRQLDAFSWRRFSA